MNDLYFACTDCKVYVDAGYRWAYWKLVHPEIVARNKPVDGDLVLAAREFWSPPRDATSAWLYDEVFPDLRKFFSEHREHHLKFWDSNDVPADVLLTWLQIGRLPDPTARFFAETLGLTSWDAVMDYDKKDGHGSLEILLYDDAVVSAFREAFKAAVAKRQLGGPTGAA